MLLLMHAMQQHMAEDGTAPAGCDEDDVSLFLHVRPYAAFTCMACALCSSVKFISCMRHHSVYIEHSCINFWMGLITHQPEWRSVLYYNTFVAGYM
jgi:hypothetical protein